jgi:hypothetical protein
VTLRERLQDWTDWDGAAWELGVTLGLWPEFGQEPGQDPWHGFKGIIWSANPVGDRLSDMLISMTVAGMLECNEEQQYRWNPAFDCSNW